MTDGHESIHAMSQALLRLYPQLGLEPVQCECVGNPDLEPCLALPHIDSQGVKLNRWGWRVTGCPGRYSAEKLADTEENQVAMRQRIVSILKHYGADRGTCRSCGDSIYWITTRAGKKAPYQADGRSHFAGCPARDQHRKGGRR